MNGLKVLDLSCSYSKTKLVWKSGMTSEEIFEGEGLWKVLTIETITEIT